MWLSILLMGCYIKKIQYYNSIIIFCYFSSFLADGQWSNVDNEQVEKLAEDPAGLTEPCTHPEVGLISSYLREVGFLVTWSLQSIRSGVVAFFRMIGSPFWRDSTHDHVD